MSTQIPNNKEVIEEITKNLTDNVTVHGADSEPDQCKNEADKNSLENPENTVEGNEIPDDFEHSDSENLQEDISDDLIDEEKLNDLEKTLSEEDKTERHTKALEFKNQGNEEYKSKNYLESINLYTEGLKICPLKFSSDRAVLYANRGAAKAKLDIKDSAIDDCNKAIEFNDKYVKAYLRRANLHEDTDKLDESLADYNKILELDPGNKEALAAQVRLPPMINERNEKLKGEMLGKLKDLGNVILRPFGLSTNNFKLTQDPNTGGYSVNFQQNQ